MAGERWLPWLIFPAKWTRKPLERRVWVPVADALDVLDDLGADVLRDALVAILDEAAPLPRGRDD